MRIVYDYPPYKRALRSFWPTWDGRCVCAVDEKGILGGCGFSTVKDGTTYAAILGLRPRWASREIYAAILRMPSAIGATETVAVCGKNIRSKAVCRYMGGKEVADGLFRSTNEGMLRRAEEIERAE